jgi:hypothetical protein
MHIVCVPGVLKGCLSLTMNPFCSTHRYRFADIDALSQQLSAHIRIYIHLRTNVHIRIDTQTHTHAHTHTHTHAAAEAAQLSAAHGRTIVPSFTGAKYV